MLHILLMILKIIGMVLLVILGVLLTVILLVLLVPVRYRLQGGYQDSPSGSVRVTWLLRALSVLVTYDGGLEAVAKVLGFPVFRLKKDSPEEETGEEPDFEDGNVDGGEEPLSGDESQNIGKEPTFEDVNPDGGEEPLSGDERLDFESGDRETEKEPAFEGRDRNAGEETPGESFIGTVEPAEEVEPPAAEETEEDKDLFEKIEYLFSTVCDKLNIANEKRIQLMNLFKHPSTQHTIHLLLRQVKKIILHVIPRKVKGDLTIGFEDPSTTGQVLAACSVLYAWYGDSLMITPDFEEGKLKGQLDMKGRIRIGALALCAVRVLIDRQFWATLKRVRKFQMNGGI